MESGHPSWFQRITELPGIGDIAARIGPWGCGGCAVAVFGAACVLSAALVTGAFALGSPVLRSAQSTAVPETTSGGEAEATRRPTATTYAGEPTAAPTTAATPSTSDATSQAGTGRCRMTQQDPAGDTFNRGTAEDAELAAVDIVEFRTYCEDDHLVVDVLLASTEATSGDYYSFATELTFREPRLGPEFAVLSFTHRSGRNIREIEEGPGGQPADWDAQIEYVIEDEQGIMRFRIPLDRLSHSEPLLAYVSTQYKATSNADFIGDDLTSIELPFLDPEGS